MFQGDTLSPIIFLLVFTPIIHFASSLPSKDFSFKTPLADSETLLDPDSPIYLFWNEPLSQDLPGWYLCKVQHYDPDGPATVVYSDGQIEGTVNIRSIQWIPAARNRKRYVPLAQGHPKPSFKLNLSGEVKFPWSSEHKVKAFADDLTLISSDLAAHQDDLLSLDSACLELGLEIRPDKCTSLHFTGKKMSTTVSIQLN